MEQKHHELLRAIGENVRNIRKQKKLTQEDISARSGIEQYYISKIESGTANLSVVVLAMVAEALEASMSQVTDVEVPWQKKK